MKNKKCFFILIVMIMAVVTVSTLFAQNLKTGRFAYPGTDLILRFLPDNSVQGISNNNPNIILARGKYSISGSRLVITFNNQASGIWQVVSGNTYIYTIDDEETFSGNGEEWIRIGN